MRQRILVRINLCFKRRLGAVENRPGGKQTRSEFDPRSDHLSIGKHVFQIVRRVVHRRHTKREVGQHRPRLVGRNAVAIATHVRMGINHPRHNRLAAHVDAPGASRDVDLAGRPNRHNAVAINHNGPVFNHRGGTRRLRHRDDAGVGECDDTCRFGGWDALNPISNALGHRLIGCSSRPVFRNVKVRRQVARVQLGTIRPGERAGCRQTNAGRSRLET